MLVEAFEFIEVGHATATVKFQQHSAAGTCMQLASAIIQNKNSSCLLEQGTA
jgi:hypothetical protein